MSIPDGYVLDGEFTHPDAIHRDRFPLSFAQHRLWHLMQIEGTGEAFHIPFGLRLKGDLNRTALFQALDRIVARHEILRTTFPSFDGEPVQQVDPLEDCTFHLIDNDLRLQVNTDKELDRLVEFEANAPVDSESGPLIRGRLIRLSECDHLLLLCAGVGPGMTLFCVRLAHEGIVLRPFWTLDDKPAASVVLDGLELDAADSIGGIGGASEAVAAVLDLASIGQCAEAAGVMASLLNQTMTHLKTRVQFGQPLANFQALQHRLTDMYAAYELSLSLTYKAAILSRQPGREQQAAVSGAKVQAAEAARLIGHEAIQMHGAMGMSMELPVGRAVKRLKAMEPLFGSAAFHLRRYRDLRGRVA